MKIAIMQPYLFPYIGYFQLINSVDVFGIGDDVQYIDRGWINRNRILINKQASLISFPVKKDSYSKNINERFFHEGFSYQKEKFLRILNLNYKKAPYYNDVIELITSILEHKETNVSKFIENQLKIICEYLHIETTFINSNLWQVDEAEGKNTEERAVEKLKKLRDMGIDHFINPIGGTQLYSKDFFKKNGLKLSFLKSNDFIYDQFGLEFTPNLSIIDVMMFNSVEQIKEQLNQYTIT